MGFIDNLLNRVTMYRLVLYYLLVLLAAAIAYALFGYMQYTALSIALSASFFIGACLIINYAFAAFFKAPTNVESVYITALILALIMPATLAASAQGVIALVLISLFAMGSKYLLTIGNRHIFNPAGIAAVGSYFLLSTPASWWVGGNLALLPFVAVGGLLIVRKLQRFDLVLAYSAAAYLSVLLTSVSHDPLAIAQKISLHSSFFFFGLVMLTEPLTTPPRRGMRLAYGALAGALFAPGVHIGALYSTPELALSAGNVFSWVVSPKTRALLTLKRKEKTGIATSEFIFQTDKPIAFKPGQYLEWTLPHKKPDNRGNRRYFTIASSPTESEVHLGVRFNEPSSSFKRALQGLEPGARLTAASLAGDFTLPHNTHEKLVFIAGGIGITPFRSMTKYLIDKQEKRDVVLFYSARTPDDIAYKQVFDEAAKVGMRTVYAVNEGTAPQGGYTGFITAEILKKEVPDYKERVFYLSGPRSMVVAFEHTLKELGVHRTRIKTDFFPGFA